MNEIKPRVSIVMTMYNGGKYVAEQIESILNQSFKNWELIIFDDCSSDQSFNIAGAFSQKDSRISVYRQEKNLGITKNFESALKKSRGQYIAVCDQDDFWLPDKLEVQLNYMINNQSIVLSHHSMMVCDQTLKKKYVKESSPIPTYSLFKYKQSGLYRLLKKNYITGPSMMFRADLCKYLIPFPIYSYQDYWIALVASTKGKIGYLTNPLVKYRQHPTNMVGDSKKRGLKYYLELFSISGTEEKYVNGTKKHIIVLEQLQNNIQDQGMANNLVRAKIDCLNSIIQLISQNNFIKTYLSMINSIRIIILKKQYYHISQVVYFTLYKIWPLKK